MTAKYGNRNVPKMIGQMQTLRAAKSIIGQEEYTATRYLYAPIANWRVR